MKSLCITVMVLGFLSAIIALADRELIFGMFGSILFGSGLISLAITEAFGRKP